MKFYNIYLYWKTVQKEQGKQYISNLKELAILYADYLMGFPVAKPKIAIIARHMESVLVNLSFRSDKDMSVIFLEQIKQYLKLPAMNSNRDLKLEKFENVRKLINKQYMKIPNKAFREILREAVRRVYIETASYSMLHTDFYALCRMFSKFGGTKMNRPTNPSECMKKTDVFKQNIIHYAGNHHSQNISAVFRIVFAVYHRFPYKNYRSNEETNKQILATNIHSWDRHELGTVENYYDVLKGFYEDS